MGGGGPFHNPFDIFESFFGGAGFGGERLNFFSFHHIFIFFHLARLMYSPLP
jgi:hypothetical protein